MTMSAHDFDHVATLAVPAKPVQAAVEREIAFGEPPVPAARAAEIVFSLGYAEPGEVSEALAPLAAAYRAADLRSLNVGDVLLVDAPDGTSTALLCDSVGWRELPEVPSFGVPGHNTDPPQITSGPEGPTMSDNVKAELLAGLTGDTTSHRAT